MKKNIIIISGQKFHSNYLTSKQEIAKRLAKRFNVYYFDPMPTYFNRLQEIIGTKESNENSEEMENLKIIKSGYRVPFDYRFHWINSLNQRKLKKNIKKIIMGYSLENPILWSFDYRVNKILGEFDNTASIYHRVDHWATLGTGITTSGKTIAEIENETISKANLVLASALKLCETSVPGKKIHYMPHGVDFNSFNSVMAEDFPPPEQIREINKPIIGYIGAMEWWFDSRSILELARKRPDVTIVLVGGVGKIEQLERLRQQKNIIFVGFKPREDAVKYLKYFHVCLIPFKLSQMVKCVNPLKLMEYFSAGKPVVSTKMPELLKYEKYIEIYDDDKSLATKVEDALKNDSEQKRNERIGIARENSWDSVIKNIECLMDSELKK